MATATLTTATLVSLVHPDRHHGMQLLDGRCQACQQLRPLFAFSAGEAPRVTEDWDYPYVGPCDYRWCGSAGEHEPHTASLCPRCWSNSAIDAHEHYLAVVDL